MSVKTSAIGQSSKSRPTARGRAGDVPAELKAALAKDRAAKTVFEALAPSHRDEYVNYVGEAKKAETRVRRAAKAVEMVVAKVRSK